VRRTVGAPLYVERDQPCAVRVLCLLPALAGIFRTGPRTPSNPSLGPPSAYPRGLQPVASGDIRGGPNGGNSPRHSKTNLDFESALRTEGTFLLKEGLDVSSLGVEMSPPTPRRPPPNNTPVVVPPTPEARHQAASGPSAPRDSSPGPEMDEMELQNKRRSMFRSPGTASSPDLATLLRKAKDNGGIVANTAIRQESTELLPKDPSGTGYLSPNQHSPRLRGSSSTSSFSVVSASSATAPRTPGKDSGVESSDRPSLPNGKRFDHGVSPSGPKPEWSMTSPRSRSGSKVRRSMSFI
jgi:PH/SEC7 domain-containing protein